MKATVVRLLGVVIAVVLLVAGSQPIQATSLSSLPVRSERPTSHLAMLIDSAPDQHLVSPFHLSPASPGRLPTVAKGDAPLNLPTAVPSATGDNILGASNGNTRFENVADATGHVEIMPMGDSITYGYRSTNGGYRGYLQTLLTNSGWDYDFVGSQHLPSGLPDVDHEGHLGWHADRPDSTTDVLGQVKNWLDTAYTDNGEHVDVVLLHIGTNDIWSGQDGASLAEEVDDILDQIDEFEMENSTDIQVVLALIINRNDGRSAITTAYNNALREKAASRIAKGDNLIVVNMEDALDYESDMDNDRVHPNDAGYEKMAAKWYEALDSMERAQPPVVNDRYDAAKDRTLYVGPPGVLANDVAAGGNPRVYYSDGLEMRIVELGWDSGNWRALDVPSTGPISANLTSLSVEGTPRVYYGQEMLCTHAGFGDNVYEATWLEDENRWALRDIWAELPGAKCEHTLAKTSPIHSVTVNGNPRVYFLGPDQHVHELAWVADSWQHRDLTTDASAPVAVPGSLAVTTITNDDPRVYYLTSDGHIHELAWRSITHVWYHRDISDSTANAASSPALGDLLSATTANLEPRVYYLAADRHIHELAWYSHRWHWRDLTQAAEADTGVTLPPIAEDSPLKVITIGARGDPRVYYLSEGSKGLHVQELAWLGNRWGYLDVTGAVEEAPAASKHALAVVSIDSKPSVYYVDNDEHVHQLSWDDGWLHLDVTTAVGDAVMDDYPYRMSATTANDTELKAKLVTDVEHGDLTFYEDGSFVYAPQAGFTGRDGFTYVASMDLVDSVEAYVEIDVIDECAPVDGNLVRNFCFADGKEDWKFYHGDHQGTFRVSSDKPFAGEQSAQVTVRAPGRNVQFYQTGIALEPRTRYELSFAAYSSGGEDMNLYIHKHRWPYSNYGLRAAQVDLEPYWKVFTLTFTTPNRSDMDNARLRFWLAPFAQADTDYHIDRVMLRVLDDVQAAAGAPSRQVDERTFIDIEEEGLLAGAVVPDAIESEEIERLFLPLIRQ